MGRYDPEEECGKHWTHISHRIWAMKGKLVCSSSNKKLGAERFASDPLALHRKSLERRRDTHFHRGKLHLSALIPAVANPYIGGIDLNGDGNAFNDRPALGNLNAPATSVALSNEINGTNSLTGFSDLNGNDISLANARYIVDLNQRTGLAARNSIRGPFFQRLDMSIGRQFGLKFTGQENLRFQFKFDVFNVLNIPNYKPGNGDVLSSNFNDPYNQGNGTEGQNTGRTARIQLRLSF